MERQLFFIIATWEKSKFDLRQARRAARALEGGAATACSRRQELTTVVYSDIPAASQVADARVKADAQPATTVVYVENLPKPMTTVVYCGLHTTVVYSSALGGDDGAVVQKVVLDAQETHRTDICTLAFENEAKAMGWLGTQDGGLWAEDALSIALSAVTMR